MVLIFHGFSKGILNFQTTRSDLSNMDEASQEAAKKQSPKSYLYTSIARTHLGDVAAGIVSCLISYGRLTAREISTRAKLPIKIVKSSLVSLIQMNCIYYWKEDNSKQVFYSFNESGLLTFLHSGDILHHIKTTYGEDSAEIIQNILLNGHVKIEDYLGNISDEEEKFEKQTLLFKLFSERWITRVQQFNYNPIDDIWNKLYQETLKNTPRSATTSEIKRVTEAKEQTRIKFADLMESGQSPKDLYLTQDGMKRLKPNLVVKFNLGRFQKHLRKISLVNLAKSRLGLLTAKIYEVALQLIEQGSPDLRHDFLEISGLINDPEEARLFQNSIENKLVDDKKIVFNVRDLLRLLPAKLDLRNSILNQNFIKTPNPKKRMVEDEIDVPSKKIKAESGDDDNILAEFEKANVVHSEANGFMDVDMIADDQDPHSLSLVQQHLKLLTSGTSIQFLIEMTPGTYTVPFLSLVKQLKQYNFETLVKTTLGTNTFRVLRCLKSLKLGDEKSIANAVLLKEKTVRNEIYKLIKLNIVEIQEVPRSADRAASKTFYLFRHKDVVSYNFLNNSIIFAMAEILTNIQLFKEDHKILLEKCNREDVKGHEEELLLDSELKTLKNLQSREISNIAKFNRLKSVFDIYSLI